MPASVDGTVTCPVDCRSGAGRGDYAAFLPLVLTALFALDTAFTVAWVAATGRRPKSDLAAADT